MLVVCLNQNWEITSPLSLQDLNSSKKNGTQFPSTQEKKAIKHPSLLKRHAEHVSGDQFLIPTPVTPDGEAGDLYKINWASFVTITAIETSRKKL